MFYMLNCRKLEFRNYLLRIAYGVTLRFSSAFHGPIQTLYKCYEIGQNTSGRGKRNEIGESSEICLMEFASAHLLESQSLPMNSSAIHVCISSTK
jgi:hypothetical protein